MSLRKPKTSAEAAEKVASDLIALDRSRRLGQSKDEQRRWETRVNHGIDRALELKREGR